VLPIPGHLIVLDCFCPGRGTYTRDSGTVPGIPGQLVTHPTGDVNHCCGNDCRLFVCRTDHSQQLRINASHVKPAADRFTWPKPILSFLNYFLFSIPKRDLILFYSRGISIMYTMKISFPWISLNRKGGNCHALQLKAAGRRTPVVLDFH